MDHPIWYALHTGNRNMALGNDQVTYMKRDVGIFAGLKNNSEADLDALHQMVPAESRFILFTPQAIVIPEGWHVRLKRDLLQMVCQQQELPRPEQHQLVPLQEKDVPAMLELTALTNPGPFFTRTIDLGNYEGIFVNNTLVAMAGQRLQPDPYTEVSAVCTHPEHLGKGYAASLVQSQVYKIFAASRIPFLHVYPENTGACRVYERLGFRTRKQIVVYLIEKKA